VSLDKASSVVAAAVAKPKAKPVPLPPNPTPAVATPAPPDHGPSAVRSTADWRKNHEPGFDGLSHKYVLEKMVNERGFKTAVEVGVDKGETFLHLLERCPNLTLYGVDVFEPQPAKDARKGEGGYGYVGDDLPGHERRIAAMVANTPGYVGRGHLTKDLSVRASERFADRSLDLVFIDASHLYEDVRDDIRAWRPKVRAGGVLAGHDLHFPGVRRAVDELVPGWTRYPQEVWGTVVPPVLVAFVPYADDRNLGRAYNEAMGMLPEDGWAVLLDHDAMFTTRDWHRQISAAILQRPEGCFTVRTNRIKCPYQQVPGVDPKNHDVAYHRKVGEGLAKDQSLGLRDVTGDREPSGLAFVLSKRAWRDAGGFPDGLHYVDRLMWCALKMVGRKIYLMEDVYLYHWHRAKNEPFQAGAWAIRHELPDGRIIGIKDPSKLPEYGK
jgi:hypothetical protein